MRDFDLGKLCVVGGLLLLACSDNGSVGAVPDTGIGTNQPDATIEVDSAPEPSTPLAKVWGATALEDMNPDAKIVEVNLAAANYDWDFEGHTVKMFAYNGQLPGPLLQANVGDKIIVHFTNNLEEPTTIHWHGMRIDNEMDGNPRVQDPVQPGETFTYTFDAVEAGSFWYHPHVNSHEQVDRGLQGSIVIHESQPPAYDTERFLIFDDILIDPATGILPGFLKSHGEEMHGRFGNRLLSNGLSSDKLAATAQKGEVERWRIVNTANARTMTFKLDGATFRVIGSDGGLLPQPYTTNYLQVAIGQRYDIEVSYDKAGTVKLLNLIPTATNDGKVKLVEYSALKVEVADSTNEPREVQLPVVAELPAREIDQTVDVELSGQTDAQGHIAWTINGKVNAEEFLFTFKKGSTIKMRLKNLAGPEHPFHLHGQFFTIVDQKTMETSQPGLKDTVLVPGMSTVEIIAFMDNPGRWMAHCHILEHAALGMMSELVVEE